MPMPILPSSNQNPESVVKISLLQGLFNGFKRLVASAKVQTTLGALTTAYFVMRAAPTDLPPAARGTMWVGMQFAVIALARECINAWSSEDTAKAQIGNQTPDSIPPTIPAPSQTAQTQAVPDISTFGIQQPQPVQTVQPNYGPKVVQFLPQASPSGGSSGSGSGVGSGSPANVETLKQISEAVAGIDKTITHVTIQ